MRNTIALNEGLQDEDLLWLFQVGKETIVQPGTAIVHQGVRPNAIFVVIRGGFQCVYALSGRCLPAKHAWT